MYEKDSGKPEARLPSDLAGKTAEVQETGREWRVRGVLEPGSTVMAPVSGSMETAGRQTVPRAATREATAQSHRLPEWSRHTRSM